MKKILIGLVATATLASPLAVTASAEAVTTAGIDYGTPYVTHGEPGRVATSAAASGPSRRRCSAPSPSFTTNGGVPDLASSTLSAKNTPDHPLADRVRRGQPRRR